jgi:hypothetical protein
MHMKQMKATGAWVLVCVMATACVLMMTARAEAGEAGEQLRKAEIALEKLGGRDLTEGEAAEAGKLRKRIEKLRDQAAEEEGARAYEARVKYEEIHERIEELEAQDLSAEGTPDRWEILTNLRAQRQELKQWFERTSRRGNPARSQANLRANLEELNHAIAELEAQDLSAEGTPDRWEWLQNHRARRKETIHALESGMAEQRDDLTEPLRGIEMRMAELREKVGDRDWTDEQRGAMQRLEDAAAQLRGMALRGMIGKARRRPDAPSNEKRRRGDRNAQQPQMRLATYRLEYADGHHVADLIIKFLPEGSEMAYDENTRHLIVLTYGPGVEYVPYLLERLDAPAVD